MRCHTDRERHDGLGGQYRAGGAARMVASVLGSDAQSFTATWYARANTVVWAQPLRSLWKLGDDEANSRIWARKPLQLRVGDAAADRYAEVRAEPVRRPVGLS